MSVPSSFTSSEAITARDFVINHVKNHSRIVNGRIQGNPYLSYKDLVGHLGYTIDDETDGRRCGIITGMISEMEYNMGRPLLSAVVVDKSKMRPGHGFFTLAQSLAMLPEGEVDEQGIPELTFWNAQVTDIVRTYGQ